ncbi:uncharacterized protein LOC117102878 isoform X2 [Anneissia japonica]|uniref:uncharacterized protein LOC117102878 isoform X2 n=1 Tax=Anneissia japonica TaxID=1529436 RepID=UPI001425A883|nr:uncharacterized protein LOC117102878 isoform X2 [Anneissia japonica]
MVPVLIPFDTIDAMKKLADPRVRDAATVQKDNQYMFPCIQYSHSHISGWHSVHKVCLNANVDQPERMTATAMRHRASTLYAGMDVPEKERKLFYKHMGHSALVNSNVYQTPMAIDEVRHIGKRLQQMDSQKHSCKDTSMNMEESEESDDDNSLMIKRTQTSNTESDDDDNNLIIKRTQTSNTETDAIGKRRQCTRASRPYTRWSKQNTTIVVKYFRKWIDGDCLPRKKEIQLFMTRNPTLKVTSWQVIRTKVLNEQRAANKRLQKHLRNVQE